MGAHAKVTSFPRRQTRAVGASNHFRPLERAYGRWPVAVVLSAALLSGPSPLRGQQERCTPTASLGIGQWVVHNGSVTIQEDGSVRYRFRTEPVVGGVWDGGPAVGRLKKGDVLVSVDGRLITTPQGWKRLGEVDPGDRVTLGVRRDGRELEVSIVADERCRSLLAPAPPAPARPVPATPRIAPVQPIQPTPRLTPLPAPPAGPALGPGAYFGFSFECNRCIGTLLTDSAGGSRTGRIRWEFLVAPVLRAVSEGGPAWKGGLRSGDTLLAVDGESITSSGGWERFEAVEPGRPVRLTVGRDGARRTFTVVPEQYPRPRFVTPRAPRAPDAPDAPGVLAYAYADEDSPLRFSDVIGDVAVEVRGEPANTFYDAEKGELIIRAPGTWIRLKLTAPER